MKLCIRCEQEKEEINFSKKSNSKDGLYYYCKQCVKEIIKNKDWYKNQYNDYKKNWSNIDYKSSLNSKLKSNLRCRLNSALRVTKTRKDNSILTLLGCSVEEFKLYLEQQFREDISWSNHGKIWEIDHIKPCSSFNLTKEEEQHKCFHFTNLQPLTIFENRSKKNKILSYEDKKTVL